jgi:hypothetical protein
MVSEEVRERTWVKEHHKTRHTHARTQLAQDFGAEGVTDERIDLEGRAQLAGSGALIQEDLSGSLLKGWNLTRYY